MNAGMGSLVVLKRHLLAAGLVSGTQFDTQLEALGKGVAGGLERVCNRRFERAVGATEMLPAVLEQWVVRRFPLEALTKVELRIGNGAWVEQDVAQFAVDGESGLIRFFGALGLETDAVRVTYTGGYWWDTTEDGSGSLPSGATALPADLQYAWLLQCAEVWNRKDRLGAGIAKEADAVSKLGDLKLVPAVADVLRSYVRYQMT